MNRLRLWAFGLAALTSAANFILVQWMWGFGVMSKTLIPGFLNFRPTFNRGVSFGLLAQDGVIGHDLLIGLLIAIVIAVAATAWRATALSVALGLGLILGGAIGNLCDRLQFRGAVFDFFALHIGPVPLFICNFADLAISAGVIVLLADSLVAMQSTKGQSSRPR